MENELTRMEKQELYELIQRVFGEDTSLKSYISGFTPQTVEIVADAINDVTRCNKDMKMLIADLMGGTSVLIKGNLRKILKKSSQTLKQEKVELNGAACRNFTFSKYRTRIITSAI